MSVDPAGVAACLKESQFQQTQVPKGDLKGGPGQTGELLVAKDKKPTREANADAIVSFWQTSADAKDHVTAVKKTGNKIETHNEVTVEGTSQLQSEGEFKDIEACALG